MEGLRHQRSIMSLQQHKQQNQFVSCCVTLIKDVLLQLSVGVLVACWTPALINRMGWGQVVRDDGMFITSC